MKVFRSRIKVCRAPGLPGARLRVVRSQDGRVWFFACDVLDVLGLERPILARLDDMERLDVQVEQKDGDYNQCKLVNIAGLLALVGVRTATDPGLARVREWLAGEVLPEAARIVQPAAVREEVLV